MRVNLNAVLGILAVGCAMSLASSNAAMAQSPSVDPFYSPRADWESRAVPSARPSYQASPRPYLTDPNASRYRPGRPSNTWVPARGVSTQLAQNQPMQSTPAPTTTVAPPVTTTQPSGVPNGAAVGGPVPGGLAPVPQTNPQTGEMVMAPPPNEGAPMEYGQPMGGEYVDYGGMAQGGEYWGGCGVGCWDCFGTGLFFRYFSVDAGIAAFKGPIDMGNNGNFGPSIGCDIAGPLGSLFGHEPRNEIGYQIGVGGVFSDFYGFNNAATNQFDPDNRNQLFFTAGFFRRPQCGPGLEWSIVFDYLRDSAYSQYNIDMKQVRGELAVANAGCVDFGFWGAFGLNSNQVQVRNPQVNTATLQPLNMYNGFVRGIFGCGGEWRVSAGASGQGDGLLGGDLRVPLGPHLALENNVLFMAPNASGQQAKQERETWTVMANLVWYPGQSAFCMGPTSYKPVLSRASNASLITDVKR